MKALLIYLFRHFLWESWQCLHEVAFHFFLLLIPWRIMSFLVEVMIRIYGLFKKMSPSILCTLTAPQNLTLSSCEGMLWTALGVLEHQYGILPVFIPICCELCLFQKWHKLWIKNSVGYQCSKSPAIPVSCFLVCRKNLLCGH